ncbi:hypothetical protein ACS0TY_012920 [Phlomoides rotata]
MKLLPGNGLQILAPSLFNFLGIQGIDLYCAIILCELCRLVLAFKTTSILVLDFSFAHEESVDYMRLLPVDGFEKILGEAIVSVGTSTLII